jgi:hypothetical protein
VSGFGRKDEVREGLEGVRRWVVIGELVNRVGFSVVPEGGKGYKECAGVDRAGLVFIPVGLVLEVL